MVRLYCETCNSESHFVSITRAGSLLGVCRSTIYYWLERDWIHWCQLPSGRRLLCLSSLRRPGPRAERPIDLQSGARTMTATHGTNLRSAGRVDTPKRQNQ
jgi:predicted DNA-binding transcriptional regulator AlpA